MDPVSVHQPAPIDVSLAPARERALRAVADSVPATAACGTAIEPVIPVDTRGWETVLTDAAVATRAQDLVARFHGVTALDLNDRLVIGTEMRRTLVDGRNCSPSSSTASSARRGSYRRLAAPPTGMRSIAYLRWLSDS